MNQNRLNELLREAEFIRRNICRLFGAVCPSQVIYTPGLLLGLRILLARLKVNRVLITTEEYYCSEDFPDFHVTTVRPEDLPLVAAKERPKAVIASVVTWRGSHLDIPRAFKQIKSALGERSPLLIADYSHAGAVGFPKICGLNADVVYGDPKAWLYPSPQKTNLGFIYVDSPNLFNQISPAFRSFFLAISEPSNRFHSRWIAPEEVTELGRWFRKGRLNRTNMIRQCSRNLEFCRQIAQRLHLTRPQSSILWLPEGSKARVPKELKKHGCIWKMPEGTRAICRADLCV